MKRRTTIEIDEDLLERARRALGSTTTRATVEEALRRAAELEHLASRVEIAVLESDEMWR
jgi:Arc/MetJ family transcription regulator